MGAISMVVFLIVYCVNIFSEGCRSCYPDRTLPLAGGRTAEELYARTQKRAHELETVHGYEVRQIWGCEWKAMLRRDRRLRKLASTAARHHLPGPLDLRKHAYFGGRVEPYALRHVCTEEEEICVLDIVSPSPTHFISYPNTGFPVPNNDEAKAIPPWSSASADC